MGKGGGRRKVGGVDRTGWCGVCVVGPAGSIQRFEQVSSALMLDPSSIMAIHDDRNALEVAYMAACAHHALQECTCKEL